MKNNKKTKTKILFWVFAFTALWYLAGASAASAAGGLSIDFQTDKYNNDWASEGETTSKRIEPVNYGNLDVSFPERVNGSSRWSSDFRANGGINIPNGYELQLSGTGMNWFGLLTLLKDKEVVCKNRGAGTGDILQNINGVDTYFPNCNEMHTLSGWYEINVSYGPGRSSGILNPVLRLQWYDGSAWTTVPGSNLSPNKWSNGQILVPPSGKQQINYLVGGVGVADPAAAGTDAQLEIAFPAGYNSDDILDEGAWLFWNEYSSNDSSVRVRNNNTGATATITGTYGVAAESGIRTGPLFAQVPKTFLADGNSIVDLSFLDENDPMKEYHGGISLVLVYSDPSKPKGVMKIWPMGEEVHHGAAHPINYDVQYMDPQALKPFFIFQDGESKFNAPDEQRHNYLAMTYGTGTPPGIGELFASDTTRIIPQAAGTPAPTGPTDRWYPMYGREGLMLDVLAAEGNYAPNRKYGDYVDKPEGDGILYDFSIPEGQDWVSFQYNASDFLGDGPDSVTLGSNESSYLYAFGMLYYDQSKLLICVNKVDDLTIGGHDQLEARYFDWDDRVNWTNLDLVTGLPTCASFGYVDVTDSADWASENEDYVTVGNQVPIVGSPDLNEDKGSLTGIAITVDPIEITATYNSMSAIAEVGVIAPPNNLKICRDNCSSNFPPLVNLSDILSMFVDETNDLVACYNLSSICDTAAGNVTDQATWAEGAGNNAVSLSGTNPKILTANNVGSEGISATYSGSIAQFTANVTCASNGCESNTCIGQTCDNGCDPVAPGTKDCGRGVWREVAP